MSEKQNTDEGFQVSADPKPDSRIRLVMICLLIIGIIAALYFLPVKEYILTALKWTESLGFWAPLTVIGIYIAACVLFLPGSIITLISDFIGIDDKSIEALSSLVKHNDLNVFWIHDQSELDAWPAGHYQLLMGQKTIGFDAPGKWSDSWIKRCQQDHSEKIQSITSQLNIPLFSVSCNREISPQILHNLRF